MNETNENLTLGDEIMKLRNDFQKCVGNYNRNEKQLNDLSE